MDSEKELLTKQKFRLPYHWIRDPLSTDALIYFGYLEIVCRIFSEDKVRIADLGCGDGRISAALVEDGHSVVGFEYFKHLVHYCRVLVEDGEFHRFDLQTPIGDEFQSFYNSFDAVIAVEVYEHLPPEKCPVLLENIKKLLKPGGIAVITVPTHLMPFSNLHYRHFSFDDFVAELRAASLSVVDTVGQLNYAEYAKNWRYKKKVESFFDNRFWRIHDFFRRRKEHFRRKLNICDSLDNSARLIVTVKAE